MVSGMWSDISTYAAAEIFKFVMGEYNSDEDRDSFIGTLKSMGIEECAAVCQDAYDRYAGAYASNL